MKKSMLLSSIAAFCLAFLLLPQTVHAAGFVQDISGVKYQNDDGTFLINSWVQVGQNIYHVDENGIVQTGWIQVGNLWYFLDANGICTNPAGTAAPPAEAAVAAAVPDNAAPSAASQTGNIFADAGWVPFQTADANALNNGVAAGLVGFDGVQYWAAPAYVQLLNAAAAPSAVTAPSSQPAAAPAAVPAPSLAALNPTDLVWLSATGHKYHSIDHCGRMNPSKARQVTLQEALSLGKEQCEKCF